MCGIGGWIEKNSRMRERFGVLNKMSDSLARRGPDENGIYVNGDAALIHRRLTVIDRENGKQPMATSYKGVTYVIVYNGELYNTEELRNELKANGFHFRGHSDTESIHQLRRELRRKTKRHICLCGFSFRFSLGIPLP